jgi:hypothetical protein
MVDRAYFSVWTSGYSEETMLEQFERLLETVPPSSKLPGFTRLVVRALSPSETPIAEHDLRGTGAAAADIAVLAREQSNADCAYEVEGRWDVWQWDGELSVWKREPEPLLLICNGPAYDDGLAVAEGAFVADIGFEHLLTGHAGLLGLRGAPPADAFGDDPLEAEFLALMTQEDFREEYQEKTRENIQQLFTWVRAVEQALPVERYRLWSEGEENLEPRLDEILALG